MFSSNESTSSGTDRTSSGTNHTLEDQDTAHGNMDIDQTTGVNVQAFRHNALVVATFPWTTGIVMAPTLLNVFQENHFGYRFSAALEVFDIKLAKISATHAFVKTGLRDRSSDHFLEQSTAEIVSAESQSLKSAGRASEVCSLLTAYRLLDVMYALEHPDDAIKAPQYQRLSTNFVTFKITKQLGDWTKVASNFHALFKRQSIMNGPPPTFKNHASRELYALYNLHTNAATDRSLFNLQLAATHIAFMLDCAPGKNDVPDLPASIEALEKYNAISTDSASMMDDFKTFLKVLANEQKYDHLRLPLQVSALLTPILLLLGSQIHKSEYFCQRYRVMLYSRSLGTERPKSVVALESVIWKAIFDIARGEIVVYDAAQVIADAIPGILNTVKPGDKMWFHLANPSHKDQVHLASFSVIESSVPQDWPMASIFAPRTLTPAQGTPHTDGHPPPSRASSPDHDNAMQIESIPLGSTTEGPTSRSANNDDNMQVDESGTNNTITIEPRRTTRTIKPVNHDLNMQPVSAVSAVPPTRTKSKGRQQKSLPFTAQSEAVHQRPVVMGSKYMQFSFIDLKQVERSSPTLQLSRIPIKPNEETAFLSYDPYGQPRRHLVHFYRRVERDMFMQWVASITGHYHAGKPKHVSQPDKSFLMIMEQKTFSAMSPSDVQIELQKGVIVVPDMNLPGHAFSRQGIRELNSLNTDVTIEDQSLEPSGSTNVKTGSLQQFFQNAESRSTRKILRVIHAPCDFVDQLPFTTDYLAWRETRSLTYCKEEAYSTINALRWNDYDNADAIQQWTLVPHGFGLYMDIRAGSKWIIIGGPSNFPFDPDHFATSDLFVPEFVSTKMMNQLFVHPEAILLTQGMRIILPPNTLYATITIEDCVTTGGYYLSSHTLISSLYGLVHSFILGTSLVASDDVIPGLYIRRLVHYFHSSYVENVIDADDDYHHLLTFKDVVEDDGTVVKKGMDDVKALFALFAMALYANVLDKRTYMPFIHSVNELSPQEREEQRDSDINAISLLERRHYCYTRGLAFDLLFWFFNNYSFAKAGDEDDAAFDNLLLPFTAELGRHMVAYKFDAHDLQIPGACDEKDFQMQVEMALIRYTGMEEAYDTMKEANSTFAFDFQDYKVTQYDTTQDFHPTISKYFEFGQTMADQKYFAAIEKAAIENQN